MMIISWLCVVLIQAAPVVQDPPGSVPQAPVLRPDDPTRPPLLPEGIFIVRAHGTLDFDEPTQSWIFKAEVNTEKAHQEFSRTFGLLPSMALDDMINHVAQNGAQVRFEVTARVLMYQGRNFLLPSLATPLGAPINSATEKQESEPTVDEDGVPEQDSSAPVNSLNQSDDAAARLEERLRARINALPRSSDASSVTGSEATAKLLNEGMRLQNRRGAIVRDQRSGTYRFVFDAQGPDALDPTMEFLPCMLLADLEERAAGSELPPAIYISGEVTAFRGRNYLLPTLWRPAAGSRNIVP